jgi:hypothetical protein
MSQPLCVGNTAQTFAMASISNLVTSFYKFGSFAFGVAERRRDADVCERLH